MGQAGKNDCCARAFGASTRNSRRNSVVYNFGVDVSTRNTPHGWSLVILINWRSFNPSPTFEKFPSV